MPKRKKAKRGDTPELALRLTDTLTTGVKSASAIAPIGHGLALIADDDEGIYLVGGGRKPELLRGPDDAEALGDLEALCTSDDRERAFAVSEESGEVFAFDIERTGSKVGLSAPQRLGVMERPGQKKNKGWEGLAYLPKSKSPKRPACLIAAHEGNPKCVSVFSLPDLKMEFEVFLDGPLDDLLDDLADVAVCPRTGNLFLLSDQSHRIAEARWNEPKLELVGAFDLDLDDDEKPEGLAFASDDLLVVVTDNAGKLRIYER